MIVRRLFAAPALCLAALSARTPDDPAGPPLAEPESLADVRPAAADDFARLVDRAAAAYAALHDYSCAFVKRKRVEGKLLPEETARMTVRARPFAVHLKWDAPRP